MKTVRRTLFLIAALALAACAGPAIRDDVARPEPTYARAPAESGLLSDIAAAVAAHHGPSTSGFRLLSTSHDALLWRLALIDSAQSSLDILTYLWYPDVSGNLVLERAILAAQRGVHLRLVVDDLMTIGQDQALANIQALPNVEVRLFNPWSNRNLGARAGEMIAEMERLNTRMHDKLMIVDGHAVILGGRNIGDHYFGLHSSYNFRDLDVLAIGPIAADANGMFDEFWNSEWVATAAYLTTLPDPEVAADAWQNIQTRSSEAPELSEFPRKPVDWTSEFAELVPGLHPGTAELVYDSAAASDIDQSMIGEMFQLFDSAQEELIITNAYIIPGQPAVEFLESLTDRGVNVKILTNSLASHDVPAVNSHYEPWRDDFISAGVQLFEMRHDPAIRSEIDVPPVSAKFSGLHTKAAIIDSSRAFIGSMNLDPRSASINTEMGATIQSPGLARELRDIMLRDMQGENAWQVQLTEDGKLQWTNSDETRSSQPTRGGMQNIMNVIFKVVPKEQY
jgi:putative cardiolipin synthase